MRRTTLTIAALLSTSGLACSSGSNSNSASSSNRSSQSTSSARTTTSSTVASTASSATPQGHATLTATGAFTLDINGPGAVCNYFIPSQNSGLVYTVSSRDFAGSGSWDLHVQGDSPDSAGVLLNTSAASFANDAAGGNGTVHAQADLHHADFDLDLVNVADHRQVVHLTGNIDCS